mgnify:CR=1 FL=1
MVVIREALALPEKNSFSYPIKPSDIHALRQDLLDALFDLLRASSTTQKQKDFLLLHSHILVIEVISLFLADTLLNKGTQTHIQNYAPSFALQNQQAYTETDYMDKPQHDPLWKKTARCVRSHLLPNYIPYIPRAWNKPHHILTFTTSDIVLAHQKHDNVKHLIRNDISEWIDHKKISGFSRTVLEESFRKKLVDIIVQTCARHGNNLREDIQNNIAHRLEYLAFYTFSYIAQIEEKAPSLPHQLWIVSAGLMFSRLMAFVARRHKREVIGHDHGSGFGWLNSEYQTLIDFNFIDRFVSYTPLMAEGLKHSIKTPYLCNQNFTPDKIGYYHLPQNTATFPDQRSGEDIKTILFIGNTYMKDRVNLYPWMFYDVAKEYHTRLFQYLRENGFRVIFRPHPDEREKDLSFISDMNIEIDDSPSLHIAAIKADAVMLDISTATSIIDMLKSGKRVILLDVEQMGTITPKAKKMIESTFLRKVVEYDPQNRPLIPENLAEEIKSYKYFSDPSLNFVRYHVDY